MRTLSLPAALLAAALALTACGKGTEPISQEQHDKMVKFAACMKQYGFDIPVPESDEPRPEGVKAFDRNDPKLQAANASCGRFAPAPHKEGRPSDEQVEHAVKMAECLRKQGVNAKDPDPESLKVDVEPDPAVGQEKVVAAFAACNKQHPAPK